MSIDTGCSPQFIKTYNVHPLSFTHTPAEIDSIGQAAQKKFAAAVDAIAKTPPDKATFENTTLALELASTELSNTLGAPLFLKYVSTDGAVRAAADIVETAVSQLFVDLFVREDLYRALKAAEKNGQKLSREDKQLQDEYLGNFRRNGLELPSDQRKIFVEKKKRLVALEAEFAKNLVEWDDVFIVTAEQLDGMPESYVNRLKKTDDGKYRITMSYPDYFPLMENGKNAETRRQLQVKFFNRGGEKNRKLLEESIQIRHETALMLGYANHAEYVLEKRMAKKPQPVMKFLDRVREKLKPMAEQNLRELLAAKREDLKGQKVDAIHAWDWTYYENQIRKNKYQVDNQVIKEYFPLDVVMQGMFDIYQTLLGVTFVEDKGAPTWHSSVVRYSVKRGASVIAHFYIDLFPRDGKYGHAAAFTLVGGHARGDGSYEMPMSSIVANFNAPAEGKPSLLEHGEVETLFHEFGHIMHQVLTQAKHATFAGTSVMRDFVEAPSQMLESWVWEKPALAKLSGHYKDHSKKLPDEMVERLVKAKLLNSGIRYLRQVSFGAIDMAYHSAARVDSTAIYHKLQEEIMLIPAPPGTMPQASFGHLMGGYDAGYYGYLWSEVYAADMYTRFENEGLLNPKTGEDYLKWILQPGGQRDPFDLIKGFLGREPNEDAFLKSIGL